MPTTTYAHFRDVPESAWRWPSFSPAEIACRGTGAIKIATEAMDKLQSLRNRLGLLAEHIDPKSGEQWGNFVQTYSMVGLINAAIRLSIRWDQAF